MLTEADLRILIALRSPKSITELSDTTDYSQSYVSERVSHLEKWDLVATSTRNRSKIVRVLHTPVLESYRNLTAADTHMDFPSLISPSMLHVSWFLDSPSTVQDIESRLALRRRRIYQLLDQLQSRGFIFKQNEKYALTEDLTGLAHFAQTVVRFQHQHQAQILLPTATVIWSAPQEALVTASDETAETAQEAFEDRPDWHMTGLPRFAEYGLEFFIAGPPPYFYSNIRDTLSPADLIAQTLLIDTDTRNLSYCALLLIAAEVDFDELRSTASYYDIEGATSALLRFVESNGHTRKGDIPLPDWAEIESLASQYGVSI